MSYKLLKRNDLWNMLSKEQKARINFQSITVEELERITGVHNPDISNYVSKIRYTIKCIKANKTCPRKFLQYLYNFYDFTTDDEIMIIIKKVINEEVDVNRGFEELKKKEKSIIKNHKNKLINQYQNNQINDEYFIRRVHV